MKMFLVQSMRKIVLIARACGFLSFKFKNDSVEVYGNRAVLYNICVFFSTQFLFWVMIPFHSKFTSATIETKSQSVVLLVGDQITKVGWSLALFMFCVNFIIQRRQLCEAFNLLMYSDLRTPHFVKLNSWRESCRFHVVIHREFHKLRQLNDGIALYLICHYLGIALVMPCIYIFLMEININLLWFADQWIYLIRTFIVIVNILLENAILSALHLKMQLLRNQIGSHNVHECIDVFNRLTEAAEKLEHALGFDKIAKYIWLFVSETYLMYLNIDFLIYNGGIKFGVVIFMYDLWNLPFTLTLIHIGKYHLFKLEVGLFCYF